MAKNLAAIVLISWLVQNLFIPIRLASMQQEVTSLLMIYLIVT